MIPVLQLFHRRWPPCPVWAIWIASARPHLLLPPWAAAATGAAWAATSDGSALPATEVRFWAGGIAWSLSLAAVHLVNLTVDLKSDTVNAKNVFWRNRLSVQQLQLGAIGLAATACGLCGWTGWPVLVCVLATLLLGVLYCLPPVQLSSRAGWDLAAHLLGYGLIAPCTGAVLVRDAVFTPMSCLPAVAYLTPWIAAAFLWTTVMDHEGDTVVGKRTSAVSWGKQRVSYLASGFMVGAILMTLLPVVNLSTGMLPTGLKALTSASVKTTPLSSSTLTVILGVALALTAMVAARRWQGTDNLRWAVVLAVAGAATPGFVHWPVLVFAGMSWWGISQVIVQRAVRSQLVTDDVPTNDLSREPPFPCSAPSDPARFVRGDR